MNRKELHQQIYIGIITLLPSSLFLPIKFCSLILLLLCINWLVEGEFKEKWSRLKNNGFWFLMVSFFAIYGFGIIYSQEFEYAFKYMERLLSFIIIPTIVISTNYKFTQEKINDIFFVFVISTVVVALICLSHGLYKNFEVRDVINSKTYWLLSHHKLTMFVQMHAVYFSIYLTLNLFFLAHFIAENFKRLSNLKILLLLFLIAFLIGFNILLGARTTLASMVIILTIGALLYFTFKGKFLTGLITFASILLIFVIAITSSKTTTARFADIFKFGKDVTETQFGGYQLRMIKWESSMEVIKDNWFLGVGTGDQKKELDNVYLQKNFEEGYKNHYNSHNQYLQTTLALGVVGLLIFLLNLFFPLIFAFKARRFVYLSFIILFALGCITESMLNVYKGVVFFTYFNTLFYKFSIDNWRY